MIMGIDPYSIVGQGKDDFLIKTAMLYKAIELRNTEQRNLATLIGNRVAEIIGQIF